MKKRLSLLAISILLLSSCGLVNHTSKESQKESSRSEESLSMSESLEESEPSETSIKESESIEESISESESSVELVSESEESESNESIESEESESESSETDPIKTIDIYSSNDIHGYIDEDDNTIGLIRYGTFMKNKGEEENTITIDQGDTWQGSLYSNMNYGALINDVMSYAKMDARTIGNHDFDWGMNRIEDNTHRSYNGYTIPVLGANIYNYDFENKVEGDIFQSQLARKTVSYVLENGLKVGIVGVIGEAQITSISSMYTTNICFKDHIKVIKEEATKLRNEENCDIVIASAHAGQADLLGNSLSNYVDLVLCGHTHRYETRTEGGILFAQFGCNNKYIGHITLTYDSANKCVTSTEYDALDAYDIKKMTPQVDETIKTLVEDEIDRCDEVGNVLLASNVSGYFDKNNVAVNVMCNAIMDKVEEEGMDDVILSYCNNARAYLPYPTWTYRDLYASFPFDNEIAIIEVTGYEIQNEVMLYNRVCRSSNFDGNISLDQTYKIACIDYLAFHTNEERNYDYFPDNQGRYISFLDDNYRIILRDWLVSNGYDKGKLMSASDFDSSLTKFSSEFSII